MANSPRDYLAKEDRSECADCDGTGQRDYFNGDDWYPDTCDTCDGAGYVAIDAARAQEAGK